MEIKIQNNKSNIGPKGTLIPPSHNGDAGYDLVASSHPKIVGDVFQGYLFKNINYIEYDTNIAVAPSKDEYGDYEFFSMLFPRSSISKYNLSLCNSVGVIDSGYRDTIKVRFNYIPQAENYTIFKSEGNLYTCVSVDSSKIYSKGDKIAQLIFSKHTHPKIKMVESLDETTRNTGGFGSTGS